MKRFFIVSIIILLVSCKGNNAFHENKKNINSDQAIEVSKQEALNKEFFFACKEKPFNLSKVSDLLNKGADPNLTNLFNGIPLIFYAIDIKNYELINILIKKGININTRWKGATPLFKVLEWDDQNPEKNKIILQLINSGTDLYEYGFKRKWKFLKNEWGSERFLKLLDPKKIDSTKIIKISYLEKALLTDRFDLAKLFLEKGTHVNYISIIENTPVIDLLQNYEGFLAYNRKINNQSVKNPITKEEMNEEIYRTVKWILNYLIKADINLNHRDRYNRSAIDYAQYCDEFKQMIKKKVSGK